MQAADDYAPEDVDTAGPFGGFSTGKDLNLKDEGGGIYTFEREYVLLPDSFSEYDSFVYNFQWYFPLIGRSGVSEMPLTVPSRVQVDFFHTDSPGDIELPRAPVMYAPGAVFFLNGWLDIALSPTGTEVQAEDATLKQWAGNVYMRRIRYINWINPNDILFP
jgi:hypothetical protein